MYYARHDHINKLIKQALGSAEIMSRLEPKGTSIQNRKRPDGISYFPFKNSRCLAWNYTCPDTLTCSHIKNEILTEAGKAAAGAVDGKLKIYTIIMIIM